jgi:hypothetical protein
MLELTLSIFVHAALGVTLAEFVWTLGLGVVAAARRAGLDVGPARALAYPAGLLLVLFACICLLITPWLGILAGTAVVIALAQAFSVRASSVGAMRRAATAVAWALAPAVGLALVLGFFLHEPTRRVDSNAFGDVVSGDGDDDRLPCGVHALDRSVGTATAGWPPSAMYVND